MLFKHLKFLILFTFLGSVSRNTYDSLGCGVKFLIRLGKSGRVTKIIIHNFGQGEKNYYAKDFMIWQAVDGKAGVMLVSNTLENNENPQEFEVSKKNSTGEVLLHLMSGYTKDFWELAEVEVWTDDDINTAAAAEGGKIVKYNSSYKETGPWSSQLIIDGDSKTAWCSAFRPASCMPQAVISIADFNSRYGTFEEAESDDSPSCKEVWIASGGNYQITAGNARTGERCLELTSSGARFTLTEKHIKTGDIITIGFYAKSEVPAEAAGALNAFIASFYTSGVLASQFGNTGWLGNKQINISPGTDWQKYSWKYTVSGEVQAIAFRFQKAPGGKTLIDDVKIDIDRNEGRTAVLLLRADRGKNEAAGLRRTNAAGFSIFGSGRETHPVFTNSINTNIFSYAYQIEDYLPLTVKQLMDILPKQAGLGSAQCTACYNNAQGYNYKWSVKDHNKITCNACGKEYDAAQYAHTGTDAVTAPSGKKIFFPYIMDKNGRKQYHTQIRDFMFRRHAENAAWTLGCYYQVTKKEEYAEKAAVILCHFAKNFPDFVFRYSYPEKDVVFYNGIPEKAEPFITRWDYWTVVDIPSALIHAYDLIYNSPALEKTMKLYALQREHIERNFFHESGKRVVLWPDDFGNMSPSMYRSFVVLGRACGIPDYIHLALNSGKYLMKKKFGFDGFWCEAALSYHQQVAGNLHSTFSANLSGYSDPAGYVPTAGDTAIKVYDPGKDMPILASARRASALLTYPDGRGVPLADTWMFPSTRAADEQNSFLLPSLGTSALCGEKNGRQTQLRTYFTPKDGHYHMDTLGITLFAGGREILSDIGYTHTKYRYWTVCSASHNLVVVDGKDQTIEPNRGKGNIRYFDIDNPKVQITDVDGSAANNQKEYRRISFLIRRADGMYYAADFFNASGGKVYDYFLHGDADAEGNLQFTDSSGKILAGKSTLTAEITDWAPPKSEADFSRTSETWYAYGFLRNTGLLNTTGEKNSVTGTFLPDNGASPLYIHIPLSPETEIFYGKNPSVRQAGKLDNSKLEDHFRKFLLIRKRENIRGKSGQGVSFTAIIEPAEKTSAVIRTVQTQPNLIEVHFKDSVDYLFHALDVPAERQGAVFSGSYGYVSVKDGKVSGYHIVHGALRAPGLNIDTGKGSIVKVSTVTAADNTRFEFDGQNPTNKDTSRFLLINHGGVAFGHFMKPAGGQAKFITVEDILGFEILKVKGFECAAQLYYPHDIFIGATTAAFFQRQFN